MSTIATRIEQLLQPLRTIPDPHERLAILTSRPVSIPLLAESERLDHLRVPGCVSRVWLSGHFDEHDQLQLAMAAESVMVRALVQLLCEIYHQLPRRAIQQDSLDFVTTLGLEGMLSPTRIQGLTALQRRIHQWAAESP